MNTLSDVTTRRSGEFLPHIGFASDVLPEAQGLPTGVSVRYAPDANKQWFVLRVSYNREQKAYDFITRDQTEAYLPMRYVRKLIKGKRKRVLHPLLPNLLFVYATPDKVETYVKQTPELSYLSYYYNHFQTNKNGMNPPLTVGYEEMMNFIRLTSVSSEHIRVVDPSKCQFKSGERVRVTEGSFAGITGHVARVAGEQRVVVKVEGVCWVATAYIPSAFIERIEK